LIIGDLDLNIYAKNIIIEESGNIFIGTSYIPITNSHTLIINVDESFDIYGKLILETGNLEILADNIRIYENSYVKIGNENTTPNSYLEVISTS
jgi:hypothetical protein